MLGRFGRRPRAKGQSIPKAPGRCYEPLRLTRNNNREPASLAVANAQAMTIINTLTKVRSDLSLQVGTEVEVFKVGVGELTLAACR